MLRKVLIWNRFEQYTGLKLCAASSFLRKSYSFSQKVQNRHFSENEQYGRLESCPCQNLAVLSGSGGQE